MRNQEGDRTSEIAGQRVFPLRFLGMGVYLTWLLTIHYSTGVFGTADMATQSLIVSNSANVIGLLLIVLFARRLAPLCSRVPVLLLAGIGGTAGTLLAAVSPQAMMLSAALFFVGNVLIGTATALLILLWNEFFAGFPRREVAVFGSGSYVLSTALYYFVGMLDGGIRVAFIALLPIASVFMLSRSIRIASDQNEVIRETTDSKWSFPWRPSLLLAVFAFAMTVSRSLSFQSNDAGMLGMLIVSVVVLLFNVFAFERFDVRMLYKAAPPLMVSGALLIAFFDGFDAIGNMLLNAGFSGFIILTLIVLSGISYNYGVTAIWLFGLTRVFRVLATVGAAFGYTWLSEAGLADPKVIGACVIVLVVTASMFLLTDRDFASSWGINPIRSGSLTEADAFYQSVEGKCSVIGHRCGLTPREEEVLVLLAQDKTIAEIEQALFISNGTAKSHIRHIYAKLGLHSRKEVVDLVAGMQGDSD